MNDDFHGEIERRLESEATHFSCDDVERPTAVTLLATHRSRRAAQSAFQTGGIAVASVCVLIAAILFKPNAINKDSVANTSEQVNRIATEESADAMEQRERLVDSGSTPETPDLESRRPAVPVFVVRTNPNGDQSVLPAWYVPPAKETIDYESLSIPEQRAVRKLLGKRYAPKRNAI